MLKDEFPELTVSKVRFLEGQGLIEPRRSPAGYRMFREDDVRRIRYILREQRDHFLPLKVIKSKLTAWERGEDVRTRPEAGPPPEAYFGTSGVSLSTEELSRTTGLTNRQIDELGRLGILEPLEFPDRTVVFRDEDLDRSPGLRTGCSPRDSSHAISARCGSPPTVRSTCSSSS